MERSGPDDARDDAWDDAFGGSSDDGASPSSHGPSGRSSGDHDPGRRLDPPDETDADRDPLSGLDRFRGFGRFEGFDPFDPADGGGGALDGSPADAIEWYPLAPLPAHERTWRHPSELGEAAWQQSEPPVSIGRGLLVTTGAIGSALGVAVLYLMLPAGGVSPAASPTATSSTALGRPPAISIDERPAVTEVRAEPSGSIAITADSPWFDEPGHTLPATDTPSTVLVMAAAADPDDAPVSVAIAIEGAPYVVTTANAIGLADDAVHLKGPSTERSANAGTSGEQTAADMPAPELMDAAVVSILGDLAFLEPSSAIEVVSFAATAPVEPGQPVTVLGDEPTEVTFVRRSVPELDPRLIVEGTPVVDDQGSLVALCTVVIDADGARVDLVPIHESTSNANPVVTAPDPSAGGAQVDTTTPSTPPVAPPAAATTTSPPVTSPTTTTQGTPATVAANSATSATATGAAGTARPSSTAPATSAPTSSPTPATPVTTAAPTAWMGLRFDGAPTTAPLTITGIVAGSPAMIAGIATGERVVAVDGTEVRSVADVVEAIRTRAPGDIVRLTLAPRVGGTTSAAPPVAPVSPAATTTTVSVTTPMQSSGSGSATSPVGTRNVSVVLAAFAPTV